MKIRAPHWIAFLLAAVMLLSLAACGKQPENTETTPSQTDETTDPVIASDYMGPEFFVATDGDDANNGSAEHPFASFARAQEAVRALRAAEPDTAITVTFAEGRYPVVHIGFNESDSGTEAAPVTYRADGEVIFDAARTISADKFAAVTDEAMRARFDDPDAILVCDLAAEGITKEEIGPMCADGTYAYYSEIDPSLQGTNISVFAGDTRLTLARYPNDIPTFGELDQLVVEEGGILDMGDDIDGFTVVVPEDGQARMNKWATIEGAWIFGYPMFDWADVSTPIESYDPETGVMKLKYQTWGGVREGGTYYLYNVPEEIDEPGEYWLDRDNMMLYYYPTEEGAADVSINLSHCDQFSGRVSYTIFDGFTTVGASGNAFTLTGNDNTIKNCTIKNSDGGAILLQGNRNTVYGNTITHVGKYGVQVSGGDSPTLTHSENLIENNTITYFAEVAKTYQYGVFLIGCGNVAQHNEIGYAPHAAIALAGQEHLYAWNHIHDVVQQCSDGGAFYSGGQLASVGNVIEHNKFENVGSPNYGGTAIYLDDCMCGVTARYNIIIHASAGFTIGGGRENEIYNNLIINGGEGGGVGCDQRCYTWFGDGTHPDLEHGDDSNAWWVQLTDMPYTEGVWAERYPNRAKIHYDADRIDDIDFAPNPSYNVIRDNIFIGAKRKWTYWYEDRFFLYSTIENNLVYEDVDRIFEPGTYEFNKVGKRAKINWETFPYDGYGTYEKD